MPNSLEDSLGPPLQRDRVLHDCIRGRNRGVIPYGQKVSNTGWASILVHLDRMPCDETSWLSGGLEEPSWYASDEQLRSEYVGWQITGPVPYRGANWRGLNV